MSPDLVPGHVIYLNSILLMALRSYATTTRITTQHIKMNSCSPQDGEPRRKRRRQSSVSAVRTSETATSPQELGHMRPSPMQGSSSFVGSGSGIYFVRTVQVSIYSPATFIVRGVGDHQNPYLPYSRV